MTKSGAGTILYLTHSGEMGSEQAGASQVLIVIDQDLDLENVYLQSGGPAAWQAAGFAVESGRG